MKKRKNVWLILSLLLMTLGLAGCIGDDPTGVWMSRRVRLLVHGK